MSDPNARSLSNSFLEMHMVSLASWSKAKEIHPRDSNGPYVLTQKGYDPQDLTMTPDEFILGRSGKWLSLGYFYRMPVAERREEFIFGTAAEAMQFVGNLTSKVAILHLAEEELPAESGKDEMAGVIQSSDRKKDAE